MPMKQMATLVGTISVILGGALTVHARYVIPAILRDANEYSRQAAREASADHVTRTEYAAMRSQLNRIENRVDRLIEIGAPR